MNTTFSFLATPTNIDLPLGITVKLNQVCVFDTESLVAPKQIEFDIDDEIENVQHVVSITLKNKTTTHTCVDENNNILSDSLIEISQIKFDDVEIDQLFFDRCKYFHSSNQINGTIINDEFYGLMGCNGTVEFCFTTPSYIWMLENM